MLLCSVENNNKFNEIKYGSRISIGLSGNDRNHFWAIYTDPETTTNNFFKICNEAKNRKALSKWIKYRI